MQISNQPSNSMHVDMVKFKLRIRLGKKRDLSDFEWGMVVDDNLAWWWLVWI